MQSPNVRLRRFLKSRGWSGAQLARELGFERSFVWRIVEGKRRPGLALAVAIERLTATWSDGPIRSDEWLRTPGVKRGRGGVAPPASEPAAA